MKNYIMMNKSKTRIRIEDKILDNVLSGMINYIGNTGFTPKTYENTFTNKVKAFFKGFVLVEYNTFLLWFISYKEESVLLRNKVTGEVFKVFTKEHPYVNYISEQGDIVLRGKVVSNKGDFEEFVILK